MGYSVRIKPNDNFEKFRAKESGFSFEKYTEKYLLYHVMTFKPDIKNIDIALCNLLMKIEKYVNQLIEYYQYSEQVRLTSLYETEDGDWKKKGELIFSGWDFSRPCDIVMEDVKDYIIDKLFTIATMAKSYDYYDDSEMFYHKQNDAQETIDYLKEECEKFIDFKVLEEYGDADDADDEESDSIKDNVEDKDAQNEVLD